MIIKDVGMSKKTKKEQFNKSTRKVSLFTKLFNSLFFGQDALRDDYYSNQRIKDMKEKTK